MDHTVQRFRFRLSERGVMSEVGGRSVHTAEGTHNLQVWLFSTEQPEILLEVEAQPSMDKVWPLFWRLCAYRMIEPLEYRLLGPRGPEDWQPVPGAPPPETPPGKTRKPKKT